jgi:hypothetical protein
MVDRFDDDLPRRPVGGTGRTQGVATPNDFYVCQGITETIMSLLIHLITKKGIL